MCKLKISFIALQLLIDNGAGVISSTVITKAYLNFAVVSTNIVESCLQTFVTIPKYNIIYLHYLIHFSALFLLHTDGAWICVKQWACT